MDLKTVRESVTVNEKREVRSTSCNYRRVFVSVSVRPLLESLPRLIPPSSVSLVDTKPLVGETRSHVKCSLIGAL